MRWLREVVYAAIVMAAALSLATTASAQRLCDDTTHPIAADSTVTDVLVPPSAICTLNGVKVHGNIVVEAGAVLQTENATTIAGNVLAVDASCILLAKTAEYDTPVGGNLIASGGSAAPDCSSNIICPDHVGGNLAILASPKAPAWCIGGSAGCAYCSSSSMTVGGNLEFAGNAAMSGTIKQDTIRGNLLFNNNTGGGEITGNDVGGNLECLDNTPTPTGSGNDVAGAKLGQCQKF
jgi:hypothetical protein